MAAPARADEQLNLIRNLIDRAPVYRAISARVALIGGLLSVGTSGVVVERGIRSREFGLVWLSVFALTLCTCLWTVWRAAGREGRPVISSSKRVALRAVIPSLVPAGMITAWFFGVGYVSGQELLLVAAWILFYGLALQATSLFAPASLVVLGWTFVLTALVLPLLGDLLPRELGADLPAYLMGLAFGGYHIVYAAVAWRRTSAGA
jgi:hypothetical protein